MLVRVSVGQPVIKYCQKLEQIPKSIRLAGNVQVVAKKPETRTTAAAAAAANGAKKLRGLLFYILIFGGIF